MNSQCDWQINLDCTSKTIVVQPTQEHLSSDGGLLPIFQFDVQIGMTEPFADALDDERDPRYTEHSLLEMVRSRVYGILADYEDQNDHDVLRSDPVFKIIAGRSLSDGDLASQPTLSRFENSISVSTLLALEELMIDQFLAAFDEPPSHLTLDIDAFDDPTHGEQQLTFFHGYYDQYQYLVRTITCAENDLVAMAVLLHGSAHAAMGADDDVRRLVNRLREAFPDVVIHLRGDSGYGVPAMYRVCEDLRILYSLGIGMNATLKKHSEELLEELTKTYEQTQQARREFLAFPYQAQSWRIPRFVIVKCEVNSQGTNRRAIVTNRPGAPVMPSAAYDEYADRGESENRHKELKVGLHADRLSDHRYLANLFRLHLHTLAHNLLARLRQAVACPPEPEAAEVPPEARTGRARRRVHNQRRQQDPLGQGQPCTWRTRLIKVAARVMESSRRIVVRLAGHWPHLEDYRQVTAAILRLGGSGAVG